MQPELQQTRVKSACCAAPAPPAHRHPAALTAAALDNDGPRTGEAVAKRHSVLRVRYPGEWQSRRCAADRAAARRAAPRRAPPPLPCRAPPSPGALPPRDHGVPRGHRHRAPRGPRRQRAGPAGAARRAHASLPTRNRLGAWGAPAAGDGCQINRAHTHVHVHARPSLQWTAVRGLHPEPSLPPARALQVVVTEQYPAKLGATVAELKEVLPPTAPLVSKTLFSMVTPEVEVRGGVHPARGGAHPTPATAPLPHDTPSPQATNVAPRAPTPPPHRASCRSTRASSRCCCAASRHTCACCRPGAAPPPGRGKNAAAKMRQDWPWQHPPPIAMPGVLHTPHPRPHPGQSLPFPHPLKPGPA